MIDYEILDTTFRWFGEAVPSPTSKNQHTQLGVHFEEVAEMIAELKGKDQLTRVLLADAMFTIRNLAQHMKTNDDSITIPDPHNMLKEICDQIVTAVGVGYMHRLDVVPAMEEVNSSNWSKFVDGKPIFDTNQKIIKGPDYFKADLSQFLPIAG